MNAAWNEQDRADTEGDLREVRDALRWNDTPPGGVVHPENYQRFMSGLHEQEDALVALLEANGFVEVL